MFDKILAVILSTITLFITSQWGIAMPAKDPIIATERNYSFNADRLVIGGYYGPDASEEQLNDAKEAGFDFFVIPNATTALLNAYQAKGLGAIAKNYGGLPTGPVNLEDNSPWLTFDPATFPDHPALWGVDLMDEPSAPQIKVLASRMHSFYDKLPNKLPLLNLFPAYAHYGSLDLKPDWFALTREFKHVNTYQKYINTYIENVDSDIITADIYPLRLYKDSEGDPVRRGTEPTWFKNLDIMAEACRKTNRKFWVITQVSGLAGEPEVGQTFLKIVDENDIRWQSYVSLAFGAKSIIHACYKTGWFGGPGDIVAADGTRQDNYYAVKNVNNEIKGFANIYDAYKNVGAILHNDKNEPYGQIGLSKVKFDALTDLKSDDTVLVGCFDAKAGNGKALMIVNANEISENKTATVSFKLGSSSAPLTSYVGGQPQTLNPGADGVYTVILKAGEGVFITQ